MNPSTLIKSMSSFPAEKAEFVHLDERYKCVICNDVLKVPMMTECGHRICKSCLDDYLAEYEGSLAPCPAKQEDCMEICEALPDYGTHREIQRLEVYCSNKDSGCKETMMWMKLKDHLAACPYTLEDCVNKGLGCPVKVAKIKLNEHLEKECQFCTELCPHCEVRVLKSLMNNHLRNACPSLSIICPFKCGEQSIKRSELERHKKVCQAKPKDCSYKDVGCSFAGTEDEVRQHEAQSANYHMELMHNLLRSVLKAKAEPKENVKHEKQDGTSVNEEIIKSIVKRQETQEDALKNTQKLVAKINGGMQNFPTKGDIQALQTIVNVVERDLNSLKQSKKEEEKVPRLEKEIGMINLRLQEIDLRLQCVETVSFDGVLIWRIKEYARRKRDAVDGRTLSLYSQPFYTSRYGYKGCARLYLNGDGMGKGTHVSFFFVLLRGDFDALLPWPFRQKVTMTLIDQETGKKNIVDSFRADPTSNSFKRPTTDMNIASGCPLFAPQSVVESSPYLKDNCIFLKIEIDKTDLKSIPV